MSSNPQLVLGIDEAGRGCVLGPLVLAGVMFEDTDEVLDVLSHHNVRDSKLLTKDARAALAQVVRSLKHSLRVRTVSPSRIDKESINTLEIDVSAKIIASLNPHRVYLDVPATGKGIGRYCLAVRRQCGKEGVEIVGGNGFDSTHLAVAAASIIAKEKREHEVRKLHKIYGDFGSGYPHDPKTRAWLASHKATGAAWPPMVRTKWQTVAQLT